MKNNFHLSLRRGKIKNCRWRSIRSHCVGKAGKVKFCCGALRRLIEVLCLLISRSLSYKEKSNISHLISGPRNSAAAEHTLGSGSLRIPLRSALCIYKRAVCVLLGFIPEGCDFLSFRYCSDYYPGYIAERVCVFGAHAPAAPAEAA
jgi:hypothetical protein